MSLPQWTQILANGGGNQPNVAPEVSINGPYAGKTGNEIQFSSAGSSDSDGSITRFQWDFGDGNTSSLENPSHSYAEAGNYTATLTVTDNEGLSAAAVAEVTVSAAASNNALVNGVAVTALQAGTRETLSFYIDVPKNADKPCYFNKVVVMVTLTYIPSLVSNQRALYMIVAHTQVEIMNRVLTLLRQKGAGLLICTHSMHLLI